MGRKRKYNSIEDQKEANKVKATRYYWAHKEACDRKAKERYWINKIGDVGQLKNSNGQAEVTENTALKTDE